MQALIERAARKHRRGKRQGRYRAAMKHVPAVLLLLLFLPSCVVAFGNTGGFGGPWSEEAVPLLREKVDSATRIVELRQRQLEDLRSQHQGGRVDGNTLAEAEVAVEQARLLLLDCRMQLQALDTEKD